MTPRQGLGAAMLAVPFVMLGLQVGQEFGWLRVLLVVGGTVGVVAWVATAMALLVFRRAK